MIAHLEVAQVQPLYATFEQGIHFARRIQIVGDFLVVDLQRDGVECEEFPHIHRYVHGDLGIGGE